MYGKGHGTGQRQRSGGNGIEYITDCVLCIGKRRVQTAVPRLHRHRQNDCACIVKARLQVAYSRAACGGAALECKRAHGVACFVQQLG
nr:hypothetical protein [Butyricicoccus sp. AM28-25]